MPSHGVILPRHKPLPRNRKQFSSATSGTVVALSIGIMTMTLYVPSQMSLRVAALTGFLCALCFGWDDTENTSQNRATCLADVIGTVIETGEATLLSSLQVERDIETSLWKAVLSSQFLTRQELEVFDGSAEDQRGMLLVQLMVPSGTDVAEKRRLAPLAEGVHMQVSYDVLKRNVDRPLATVYYVDARRKGAPLLELAAFLSFETEKQTWIRVPIHGADHQSPRH
jgi:hypothetical protein